MKKMKVVRSRKKFNAGGDASVAERMAKASDKYKINEETGERYFDPRYVQNETGGYGVLDEEYTPKKSTAKPATKPAAKPAAKPAESKSEDKPESKPAAKSETKSDEVPSVEKIKKEQEGTSEGTSTSEKLKSGLSDTAEKVLGAMGASAGAAALGRQAYKMAKAPLGFMGEAKRMASNVGQSLRNAVSGRKPSAAGEGAEAAAQATKSVGPSQFEKAKTAAQRSRNAKLNKRDVKQPKPTDDEKDLMRMGSDYMKRGGKVQKYAKGGSVGSASRRGDGIAMRGKTRGRMF